MAESRSPVTLISVVIAVLCAGWAIYATKHSGQESGPSTPMPMAAPQAGPTAATRSGQAKPGAPGAGATAGGPATPVVTAAVRTESLARELRALGTARANEAVEITSKLSNIVTAIRFTDGQTVAKGQVLVELDSAQARADLSAAEAALTESVSQYNRSKELLATQVVSRSQFDQLEATKTANAARVAAARAKLEDTVIRAPFSGRVGLRRISLGSLINPGAVITTLDDLGTMKVDFDVPENSLPLLRTGLPLTAMSSAFPDRHFVGTVASIDSRIDPTTRSVTVRGIVPNPDGLLKPGMFLTIELTRDQRSALVIPEEALVPEQDKQFVYVVQNGKSLRREVRIGQRSPGSVEIVQGLSSGERVIVEGTVKVRDGGDVRDSAAERDGAGTPSGGATRVSGVATGAGAAAANPAMAAK